MFLPLVGLGIKTMVLIIVQDIGSIYKKKTIKKICVCSVRRGWNFRSSLRRGLFGGGGGGVKFPDFFFFKKIKF